MTPPVALPAPFAKKPQVGTVYLLHFSRPYYHARHYVGFTTRLDARVKRHRRGDASPLVAAVVNAGIEIFVARTWENVTRAFERRMHRWRQSESSATSCPICCGPRVYKRRLPRRDPITGIGV